MADPPDKKGPKAPRPMAMDNSVAHVGVMRPLKRRPTKSVPQEKEDTAPDPSVETTEPSPPPVAAPTPPPEPKLPDITRREADQLITMQITPFVAALKTDYSAEHIVFSARAALDEALAKARRIVGERRELLAERVDGYAGPNVERVEDAWDDAIVALGEIYLQEDHWSAEPESLVGEWRHKFATGPDGERLCVVFYRISGHALRPREAATAVEEETLPMVVEAVLELVDWDKNASLTRALSPQQAERIGGHRDRLDLALAGVTGTQRAHYLSAYHSALGAVATGDPQNRFRSATEDGLLAGLWIDLVTP